MKTIKNLSGLCLLLVVFACSDKKYFDSFIGTYVPLSEINNPIFSRIQIEKRHDFYLLAAENSYVVGGNSIMFFVCEKAKGHLIIRPSQYLREDQLSSRLLTKKTKIYYDKELMNIFLLNTVYIPSNNKIFEIIGNKIIVKKE
jgi:hypothetical protein